MTVESAGVQIVVGPVSHESAEAWLDYADEVVGHFRSLDDPPLPDTVLDTFEDLLTEWRRIASSKAPFHWVSEESPERTEFLINALYQAGEAVEKEVANGEQQWRPPEADEFHHRLIDSVLGTLASEGPPYAQFADELRALWGIPELA